MEEMNCDDGVRPIEAKGINCLSLRRRQSRFQGFTLSNCQ